MLFGLEAPREAVDTLFDSFDPDGSGTIEFRELHRLLRTTVAPAPTPAPAPSLLKGTKWGKTAAKMLIGKSLATERSAAQRLREALAKASGSVHALFLCMDENGDGKISRSEFVGMVPQLELDEQFEAADCDALFSALDRDRSGWIQYSECAAPARCCERPGCGDPRPETRGPAGAGTGGCQ